MLISNPFANVLFLPLLMAVVGLLSVGLLGIVAKERNRLPQLGSNSLFVRWRSWAVIAPVAILSAFSGPLPLIFVVNVVVFVALDEFSHVTGLSRLQRNVTYFCGVALLLTVGSGLSPAPTLVASLFAIAAAVMFESDGTGFERAGLSMIALVWIALLGSFAIPLSRLPGGPGILLAVITASACSNVMAFVFGKLMGKRKLAPTLSPNKTWAGAGGTLVGAYLGLAATTFVMPSLPVLVWLAIPPIITVVGITGDLFESLMKRSFHVKDAASWLPGFGGIMDRIDGLLFVLPAVYYLLVLTTG